MSIKIIYQTKNGKKGSQSSILEGDTNNLTDGSYLFYGDKTLTLWDNDLSSLKIGKTMFHSCTNLSSFERDLSNLTIGEMMFYYCPKLTSFSSDLSSLTNGNDMFHSCGNLISFTSDLSSLTDGSYMFDICTKLSSFTSDLSSLTIGEAMFQQCKNLTSFSIDLSSLTDGRYMFAGCTNLTSFTSDLSSLNMGINMFHNCKLNAASVKNIADTINTYNGGRITIHVDDTLSETDKNTILSHFNTISNKGWTVDSNLSTVATVNEDGEIVESTMVCAKVDESYDDYYTHLDNNGNKVILRTAKMVIGPRENEWTVFASLEDAEQHFGLTRVDQELNKL